MRQRIRRLREWAMQHVSGVLLEKTLDLCDKKAEWDLWYKEECENSYTTSNALDRLMRSQNRYFERGQHFHGTLESANLRSRAWAILHNYWDWGRKTQAKNEGYRCPAERLNGKRYADNWLENLLVAGRIAPWMSQPPPYQREKSRHLIRHNQRNCRYGIRRAGIRRGGLCGCRHCDLHVVKGKSEKLTSEPNTTENHA